MTPKKIKCFSDIPPPNCRVIVEAGKDWETRVYNEDDDWVYAYHKGYLWPQRPSGKYYRFELVAQEGLEWQKFKSYKEVEND